MTAEIRTMPDIRQIYVILNPIAGHSDVDAIRKAVDELCELQKWTKTVYETTGAENEDVTAITRKAASEGADLVVAAGGDGTVSQVINGLVGTNVPLGVIPAGTGNGLARAMRIPLDPRQAVDLFAQPHMLFEIDAMQVGDKYYVLNVSSGISSRAMEETKPEEKKRFGMLAYAQKIVKNVVSSDDPPLFRLKIDNHDLRIRANEVLVSNGELVKEQPILFGDRDTYNDGHFNVNILTANTPGEYLRLAFDLLVDPQEPKEDLKDLAVHDHIRIESEDGPQPVQADGEVAGETPVEVRVKPRALKILVPLPEEKKEEGDQNGK
jgi:YegS/Rv2252/BmrU family lipid kinase